MQRNTALAVDGVAYDVRVDKLTRSGIVTDGKNAGRTVAGKMLRDVLGTFYNYSLTLGTLNLNADAYDRLFEVLSAPVNSHNVTLPYGQGTLTFEAYVTSADDELIRMGNGCNLWSGLTVDFIAMEPKRSPE